VSHEHEFGGDFDGRSMARSAGLTIPCESVRFSLCECGAVRLEFVIPPKAAAQPQRRFAFGKRGR
jgi:hypothetical protein